MDDIKERLRDIKKSIENENISYGEIVFLADHKEEVLESRDIELAQWAGIDEEEYQNYA